MAKAPTSTLTGDAPTSATALIPTVVADAQVPSGAVTVASTDAVIGGRHSIPSEATDDQPGVSPTPAGNAVPEDSLTSSLAQAPASAGEKPSNVCLCIALICSFCRHSIR